MKEYFDKVMRKLEAALEANEEEEVDPILRNANGMKLVKATFRELHENEEFMQKYTGSDVSFTISDLPFTIAVNKEFFPRLLAHYLFFELRCGLEFSKLDSTIEEQLIYLKQLGEKFRKFYNAEADLLGYYHLGWTDQDREIFLKNGREPIPELAKGIAALHNNAGSLKLAIYLAVERFVPIFQAAMNEVEEPKSAKPEHHFTWAADILDLAELVLGLFESENIHCEGKPATLSALIELWAGMFENVTEKQLEAAVREIAGPDVLLFTAN